MDKKKRGEQAREALARRAEAAEARRRDPGEEFYREQQKAASDRYMEGLRMQVEEDREFERGYRYDN